MSSEPPHAPAPEPDRSAPHLAAGLTRIAAGALIALLLLGGGATLVIVEIKTLVERVRAVAALDDAWDALVADISARRSAAAQDAEPPAAERVAPAHARLLAELTRLERLTPADPLPAELRRRHAAAAALLRTADAADAAAARRLSTIRAGLGALLDKHQRWKRIVDARHAEAARLDRASRGRQRELNDRLTRLASATLSAARVQREIDAVARYNATDAGRSISLERVVVVAEGVPAPCGPDAPGDAERLCAPSSARVHDALAQLEASAPEDLEKRIQTAQWALVGYVRAGERRFRALSAELSAALDAAASARGRLDRAAETLGSLSRLLRIVRQADETLTRATRADGDRLDFKDSLLRAVLTQIDLRASGTAAAIGEAAGPARDAAQTIEAVRADWAEAFAALKDRRRAEAALDGALAEVGATLSRIDAATNAATAYWVGLVSTAALTAIGALCAVAVALAWGARGMIAAPLAQTTATLLALSRDEPVRPVRLTSRALGFGALEQALERLRLANIERAALTRTTLEQRAEIERNLDALARTTREMERQARHDALTGLPNRRFADEVLGGLRPPVAEAAGVAEAAPQDFTILHIDVDRFKEINDTLGHDAGDAVLRHIADLLTALIGPNDRAFRIGGDEFLILRQAEASKAGASKLAADIIAAMNAPVDFQGHACRIGASIGVAHGGDAGFDGRTALVNADIALYEAKNAGRNRCAYFSKALQERTVSRKTLTDQLRVAIEREAFEPVYQPQFFARGLALRGVETLCRWRHPEHGLLAPGAFLAQAEEANLVGAIDEILLRKAGRDLAAFRAAGLSIPKISFNVTADRLTHAGLAETLLREVGAETTIAVELLESMSLDTLSETVRWAIDELKDRGIAIEIDDFGSCRASVAGLMAVGPDTMKIDGAIVGPITTSEQHFRLVKAIIDIGAALGIEVVAERVETAEHVRVLSAAGDIVLQGFALAKPMSADDLLAFLSARAPRAAADLG